MRSERVGDMILNAFDPNRMTRPAGHGEPGGLASIALQAVYKPPKVSLFAPSRDLSRAAPTRGVASERHLVAALQSEHLTRLGRRGDFQRQLLDNAQDLRDLLRVGLGESPLG